MPQETIPSKEERTPIDGALIRAFDRYFENWSCNSIIGLINNPTVYKDGFRKTIKEELKDFITNQQKGA